MTLLVLRLILAFSVAVAFNSTTAQAGPADFITNAIEKISNRFKKQPPPEILNLDDLVPREMRQLPVGVQRWYVLETDFLSRVVDRSSGLSSPTQNEQLSIYTPEAKLPFKLTGYWVPIEKMQFKTNSLPAQLEKFLLRERSGQKEALFFIHPETERVFSEILSVGYESEIFWAAATSSSRSLLVWKPGYESQPFIAKVSLYRYIGHVLRSILASEASYGVTVNDLIVQSHLARDNIIFMNEVLSATPIGRDDGGMIIRAFPKEILNEENITYAPLFSLYASAQDEPVGLLLQMLQNSNLDPRVFVRENIIRPFVQIWSELAIKEGLTIEAHAQNILVELNGSQLTGRFVFRDFGGISVDEKFRKKVGRYVSPDFKKFNGQTVGNFGRAHSVNLVHSLETYFSAGFLYNIDLAIQRWASKGWLQLSPQEGSLRKGWAKALLLEELSEAFDSPQVNFSSLPELIERKQNSQNEHFASNSCEDFL
jgi:hypothetical protein